MLQYVSRTLCTVTVMYVVATGHFQRRWQGSNDQGQCRNGRHTAEAKQSERARGRSAECGRGQSELMLPGQ